MSETANALGVPAVFEFEGAEYKVGPRSLRVEAMLERRLQDRALREVQAMREHLRPDEYRMMLDGVRRDAASRVYSWGSESCIQFLITLEGAKELAFLQLCDSNQGDARVDRALIDRVWEDPAAFERLTAKFEEADADPNRKRAAK